MRQYKFCPDKQQYNILMLSLLLSTYVLEIEEVTDGR